METETKVLRNKEVQTINKTVDCRVSIYDHGTFATLVLCALKNDGDPCEPYVGVSIEINDAKKIADEFQIEIKL